MKHPKLKILAISSFLLIASTAGLSLLHKDSISAQDSDFSNGITVDSTLDTSDTNIGDGICDDGSGNCTLRAAIEEANSNPDASTINFNITGTPDFTNNSQDGYTISPQSSLPEITEQVTIDGYSQPGASANNAVAPSPLNGTLLIEIDGIGAGDTSALIIREADQSSLHGLVVNNFNGTAALIQADDVVIRGNYLGTDPEGLTAKPNVVGVNSNSGSDRGENALIGGLNPEDRNIISGNTAGGGNASGGYPGSGWVFKGNYIGVGADGLTAIPNSSVGGSGGLSIDNTDGTIIGGTETTAINVISGNLSHGLAPHVTTNHLIQNNYIGVGYDGTTPVPNGSGISGGAAITVGSSSDLHILDNIISNNSGGVYLNEVTDSFIQGNAISNTTATSGIDVGPNSYDILIGGSLGSEANQIYGNSKSGISSASEPQNDNEYTAIGNSIDNNNELGIELSYGGTFNDPLDSDSGSNDLLNFPLYTNIQEASGDTTVDYLLDVPAGDYRIEFFSNTTPDPSGYGEGEEYLGFQNVTSTGTGEQTFSHTLTGITGVTNLAMTTTEIDESTDGFGATSEFGGELIRADISITKTLTNPQDIAIGATANYQITYTNNGPDDADLSGFSSPGASEALLYDLVPADLINPSGYITDGPFPGTSIIDVGNPDLTCLYGPAPGASQFGFTTDTSLGAVVCWLTGSDATLESSSSINAELSFEVAPDSDLVFTNYVIASATSTDPDSSALSNAFDSGDPLPFLATNPLNNFAAAAFPVSVEPEEGIQTPPVASSSSLSATGSNISRLILVAGVLIVTPTFLYLAKKHSRF